MKAIDIIITAILAEVQFNRPAEQCPNCWGVQEYGGKYRKKLKLVKIDLNNINLRRGWIQAWAVRRLEGLQVRNGVE